MTDSPATNADGPARSKAGVGLFCGTFNPIHVGHLILAECARDQYQLEKVLFITSPQPPHRQGEALLPAHARHEMVSAAVSDNPAFEASSVELERSGPSYTIDTVQHFQGNFPGCRIALLIGEDNLHFIKSWHRASELIGMCHLLVAPRVMASRDDAAKSTNSLEIPDAQVDFIDFPHVEVSATSIRHRIRCGKSVRYMVPQAVAEILERKLHYR
jgi:nicotinate-nucleotide adenylyltransferase